MTTSTYRAALPFNDIDQISQISTLKIKLKIELISDLDQIEKTLENASIESLFNNGSKNFPEVLKLKLKIKLYFKNKCLV